MFVKLFLIHRVTAGVVVSGRDFHPVFFATVAAVVQLVNFLGISGNLNQAVGFFAAALAVPGFARHKLICLVFFDKFLY